MTAIPIQHLIAASEQIAKINSTTDYLADILIRGFDPGLVVRVRARSGYDINRIVTWAEFEDASYNPLVAALDWCLAALDAPQAKEPAPATEPKPAETPKETRAMSDPVITPAAAPVVQVVEQRNHAAEIAKMRGDSRVN